MIFTWSRHFAAKDRSASGFESSRRGPQMSRCFGLLTFSLASSRPAAEELLGRWIYESLHSWDPEANVSDELVALDPWAVVP